MKPKKRRQRAKREKLVILYEDRHILVAVKPPGMLSQGDITRAPDMLTEIKEILWEKSGQTRRPFLALVHRLDRPASGLMVFARSSKAASRLGKAFRTHQVVREYVAITRGIPEETGVFSDLISKEIATSGRVQVKQERRDEEAFQDKEKHVEKHDIRNERDGGHQGHIGVHDSKGLKAHTLQEERLQARLKRPDLGAPQNQKSRPARKEWLEASLSWKRLSTDWQRDESLLLVTLSTGRKHQIRAQFAANGTPLLGDRRYGKGDARDRSVPTVALHACRLTFMHPVDKTICTFNSLPDLNPSFSDRDGIVLKGALERHKPDLSHLSP